MASEEKPIVAIDIVKELTLDYKNSVDVAVSFDIGQHPDIAKIVGLSASLAGLNNAVGGMHVELTFNLPSTLSVEQVRLANAAIKALCASVNAQVAATLTCASPCGVGTKKTEATHDTNPTGGNTASGGVDTTNTP